MRSASLVTFITLCSMVIGCGGTTPGANPAAVAVTGNVVRDGKPVSDVVLNLQPTGPGALPLAVTLKDGKFEAQVNPGKYTWYFSEASKDVKDAKKAFAAIPTSLQEGSMDRQIDVESGKPIEISVN
jgi:hypothetical protein